MRSTVAVSYPQKNHATELRHRCTLPSLPLHSDSQVSSLRRIEWCETVPGSRTSKPVLGVFGLPLMVSPNGRSQADTAKSKNRLVKLMQAFIGHGHSD